MFGRVTELAEVLAALRDPKVRLVTLTGRGGVGKTRLAMEAVRSFRAGGGPEVVAVALAGVSAPELVVGEIAAASGVAVLPRVDATDAVVGRLQRTEAVLVLDNFEHLLGAAPLANELLDRCEHLTLLVTSQAPLRLRGEHVMTVDPLPVPDADERDPAVLAEQESVATYCARAAAVDHCFALDDRNAAAIAALCRELEGLPLAIELAAARAATLPAADITRRLRESGLDLLRRSQPDTPTRHHELRAAIDWTYRLLAPAEQRLLRRLSLIFGTFDLDTVDTAGAPATPGDAVDQLASLVDLHLVDPVPGHDPVRFEMPSSIRAFGHEQLDAAGEYEPAQREHIAGRVAEARAAAVGIESADEASWLERLHADHVDLVAALDAALDLELAEEALDLVAGLAPLWKMRGYHAAEEARLERALKLARQHDIASVPHANVLIWSAGLGLWFGASLEAPELVDRLRTGEALARALADDATTLRALAGWLLVSPFTGDVEHARAASDEGLELAARTGNERRRGELEAMSGMVAQQCGDDERAVAFGRAAVARARRHADRRTFVLATLLLTPLRRKFPEIAPDVPAIEEALEYARDARLTLYEALLLPMLVGDAITAHDGPSARRWAKTSLAFAHTMPDCAVVGYNLMTVAQVAAFCGDPVVAAFLHGTVSTMLPALTLSMAPQQVEAYDAALARIRTTLAAAEFDAQVERGTQFTWTGALDEATIYLDDAIARFDTPDARAAPEAPAPAAESLTDRQREVLQLLAAGLGNKEIGARLGVSPKTVMHHTTAIYRALGVRGRSEAAVVAVRNGLA